MGEDKIANLIKSLEKEAKSRDNKESMYSYSSSSMLPEVTKNKEEEDYSFVDRDSLEQIERAVKFVVLSKYQDEVNQTHEVAKKIYPALKKGILKEIKNKEDKQIKILRNRVEELESINLELFISKLTERIEEDMSILSVYEKMNVEDKEEIKFYIKQAISDTSKFLKK